MGTVDKEKDVDANDGLSQQGEPDTTMGISPCSFQAAQLLPEIRIDTSRLDGLLSGFQRRLTALESSFSRVAESAAEAAHKVGGP